MSTYLVLCQSVHRWVRSGNHDPGSRPVAIASEADPDVKDIIFFVNEAWQQIQQYHPEWEWMRRQGTLNLVAGTRTYSAATIRVMLPRYEQLKSLYGATRHDGPRYGLIQDSAAATNPQMPTYYVPYNEWRGFFDRAPRPANSFPIRFTTQPDETIEFDPAPSLAPSGSAYRFAFDYRVTPQALSADADVPELPDRYHDLIVWWAVRLFCASRANSDALEQTAIEKVKYWLSKVAADQLPEFIFMTEYS